MNHLTEHDVFLVFDRYHDYSIKGVTRAQRTKNVAMKHTLSLKTRLPEREIALGPVHNKVQSICLLAEYIASKVGKNCSHRRLFVTSADEIPILVCNGIKARESDMRTSHEEADIIIVQQCYGAVSAGCRSLKVISDDTDVFVLLTFFYLHQSCKVPVFMEDTHGSRTVVDIAATVKKWPQIIPMLPAIKSFQCYQQSNHSNVTSNTCFNWMRYYKQSFWNGKKTALKVSETKSLSKLGDKFVSMDEVTQEATAFIGTCYGTLDGFDDGKKVNFHSFSSNFLRVLRYITLGCIVY